VETVKRQRTATESLLSITLALEACLVFFAALAAFALDAVTPIAALVGGLALIVLFVACARLVRYPFGIWFGWVLQGALIAAGILLPIMYIIGTGFLALWIYCFTKGRSLDRARVSPSSTTDSENSP
jgi:hypothetical protein